MNNYLNILIESAIDKAVNEATYNGYDIPEVNGTVDSSSMVKVYRVLHSEQIESVLKNGYSREFARSTDNSWYGEGVYCTVNFKDTVENAVKNVLKQGYRTQDIASDGTTSVSTTQMGDLIVKEIQNLLA